MKTSALKASVDFWLELFSLSLSVYGVKVLLTVVHSLKDFQEGSFFVLQQCSIFYMSSFRIDPLKRSVGVLAVAHLLFICLNQTLMVFDVCEHRREC